MLVDVHVQRQAASFGESEQKIEKGQRLVGVLRNAAYDISAGGYRRLKPPPASIELSRCITREMRDHLQGNAVAAVLTQSDQRFNATDAALGFDVGVAADGDGAMRQALFDRASGACCDVIACGSSRKGTVARGRTREGRLRVAHQPPRAGFVEVLVNVNKARHDKSAVKVDNSFGSARRYGNLEPHDTAICANGDIKTLGSFNARALHATIREKKRNAAQATILNCQNGSIGIIACRSSKCLSIDLRPTQGGAASLHAA
jgi:hypothetical protein